MGFSIRWIENNPIVTISDHVDFEIINNANNAILSDPRFDDMKYQIFDHSHAKSFLMTNKEMEMVGVLDKNSAIWNKKVKVALIFANMEISDKLHAYLDVMEKTQWKVRIFDNYHDAESWCLE